MGDLILINGEVKEAWRRLVKVLSKAMTGRTVERERESKCFVWRKREVNGKRSRAAKERSRGGASVSVRARVCRAIIEFPPRNNEVLLTPTLGEVHPI